MIAWALRLAPSVLLAGLALWTATEILQVGSPVWAVSFLVLFTIALVLLLWGIRARRPDARRAGIVLVGITYYGAGVVALGVQPIAAVVFLTLLIVYVELRFLSDRFAPLYFRTMAADAQRRVDGALARAMLRLLVASVLAVFVPIFAADLALSGLVPLTSILTAIFLAAGLVAIVALLALLPLFERRTPARTRSADAHPKG